MPIRKFFYLFLLVLLTLPASAQKRSANLVYVDRQGVLRYTNGNAEAAFFGVNYTVPFAYGYRSHKALGVDLEKAIDADVAHMARLGLDAFRVHVWDVEISDSAGNLLENEHLRLFDYLLMRLRERNIRIIITPIAFWGNGYPEPDEKTPGFATKYGKGPSVVAEAAIVAQEQYIRQFFTHVNPYTKLSYGDDPDVIAVELNNEPHHSGPRERTTEYINRLAAALRGTGWTKPVFYNISESPSYAGAVAAANVDGHSFQWYPTGLVAGHEQKGNFLPNVDQYRIPFFDSIPALKNRALMVYEFDAGDVLQSNMYPAMARAFRTAGFQWATQFAYDPMATAYANTEYQTHFLNLVYTPGKAISLLIAAKAFHQLPRGKSWGTYPQDTVFGDFHVSYAQNLSEMNSDEEFYYSNNTATQPRNAAKLRHVAAVGSSPIAHYEGYGAYFLDKLPNGNWRLELLPDPIVVNDPFGKAAPSRDAVRVHWAANKLQLRLPGLGAGFRAVGLDSANRGVVVTDDAGMLLKPGVYEIGASPVAGTRVPFYAPKPYSGAPYAVHHPSAEAIAAMPRTIVAQLGGVEEADKVSVELRHSLNRWKTVQMQRRDACTYAADLPSEMTEAGLLEYRILLQKASGDWYTFPSGLKGYPYAWDYVDEQRYATRFIPSFEPLALFDAARDRDRVTPWIANWRMSSIGYSIGAGNRLALRLEQRAAATPMGCSVFAADRLAERPLDSASGLALTARSRENKELTVALVDRNGIAWTAKLHLNAVMTVYSILCNDLKPEPSVLLPRPYPGFQPLLVTPAIPAARFDIRLLDKVFFRFDSDGDNKMQSVEIQSLLLIK